MQHGPVLLTPGLLESSPPPSAEASEVLSSPLPGHAEEQSACDPKGLREDLAGLQLIATANEV